jgi:hypothetical protein
MHFTGEIVKQYCILLCLICFAFWGCGAGGGAIAPLADEQGMLIGQVIVISLPEVRGGATVPPSFYAARKITIRSADRGQSIAQVALDDEGGFSIPLKAGTYIVDITRLGIDRTDTPKEIVIQSGEVTEISIRVDTGLR